MDEQALHAVCSPSFRVIDVDIRLDLVMVEHHHVAAEKADTMPSSTKDRSTGPQKAERTGPSGCTVLKLSPLAGLAPSPSRSRHCCGEGHRAFRSQTFQVWAEICSVSWQ